MVEEIIDGNLKKVAININLIGGIGNKNPIYVNKSLGVPGVKNSIHISTSAFLGFLNNLLFSIFLNFFL